MVGPYLLDVNILIALLDRKHIHHSRAMHWFMREGVNGWASCPVTQNGAIRIMSRPGYANPSFTPEYVANLLESLIRNSTHTFIAEDLSILDRTWIDTSQIHSHGHVTDTYLLALARKHGSILATMDMALSVAAVSDGERHLLKLP